MTFYFYDLETSGINPKAQRIMQFAGQRTDEDFNPIGEPQNWLIRLTEEVLPDPDAVVITGITPQKTLEEGYTEAEFLTLFSREVLQPDTVICGFNTVRFDDEFMRYTLWRNFYDPYEWQWQDGRSRWDLMDASRMIRALRPKGIEWPFQKVNGEQVPSNRLELLTTANGLDHKAAHDALSDVQATIAIARLLRQKQPKIFDYLLKIRTKKQVLELVAGDDPQPFLYTSGRYSNKWLKTTAVAPLAPVENGNLLVFDLRQDPSELAKLKEDELAERVFTRSPDTEILAVKLLKPNTCPAVAPLGVLDEVSQQRLALTVEAIEKNYQKLRADKGLVDRIVHLFENRQAERKKGYAVEQDPDCRLYDGFPPDQDKVKASAVRAADENTLADLSLDFTDERLEALLPRYKARNFPRSLTASERQSWEEYRIARLTEGVPGQLSLQRYSERLGELAAQKQAAANQEFLLTELQLYAESIVPLPE